MDDPGSLTDAAFWITCAAIVGLLVLGVLNNGLDHIQIDSFLKILIRGLILLMALVVNVYAQVLREKGPATD